MENQMDLTVAEIAVKKPNALRIFTHHNIDYCCGGHKSFREACKLMGLDPEAIWNEIISSGSESGLHMYPETWTSSFMIDYIIANHHQYVRNAIPDLEMLLEKVCLRHGEQNGELPKVRAAFLILGQELLSHMEKEEGALFPAIKRFEAQNGENDALQRIMQAPIGAMEEEHEIAGQLIHEIQSLTRNYSPPDYACPTFQMTYARLKEFQDDLMMHIHLENNVLFPRFKKAYLNRSCVIP